jgi:uncharacterized protein (TIGR02246 family)
MASALFVAAVILFFGYEQLQSADEDRSSDEEMIRGNAKGYEEAYNTRDAKKLAQFWGENATYIDNDTNEKIVGRNGIEEYFKGIFQENDVPKIDIVVDTVEFKSPDEAIEKGHVTFTVPNQPGDETSYIAEDRKENGKWVLQNVTEVESEAAAGETPSDNYEHLKALDWLVGKWVDQSEGADVTVDTVWSKEKAFLIQHFDVKTGDDEDFEGYNIIGWDPKNKTIRSWIFDTDGGYGEGKWVQQGKSWYVTSTFVQSDGGEASSTNVYTPGENQSYTFAVVERDVAGEVLPNVEPIKFVKREE